MNSTLINPDGFTIKIVEHTNNEVTPLQESYKKLNHNINAMLKQWFDDFSRLQEQININKGIAGDFELFN